MAVNTLIEFKNKCIPTSEYVVLRSIDRGSEVKCGEIYMPNNVRLNDRLAHYQVLAVGEKAHQEYGLKEGDYVVGDRLAQAYQTAPVSVMKYVNIIALTNEDNTKFKPLKNMIFVRKTQQEQEKIGEVFVPGLTKKINIGVIEAMNIDESVKVPYKVGDKIMLVKGGDSFTIGGYEFIIYKHDMVACVVTDEKVA